MENIFSQHKVRRTMYEVRVNNYLLSLKMGCTHNYNRVGCSSHCIWASISTLPMV